MTTLIKEAPTERLAMQGALEWIPADAFTTDSAYDRPASEFRINAMAEKWDDDAIGVVYASRRNDRIYLIDGQHRVGALKKQGRKKDLVPTLVFDGLSVADEAKLFVLMNKNRKALTPSEIFQADLAHGDKRANEINAVLASLDLTLSTHGYGPKVINAVQALLSIYKAGGADAVDATLSLVLIAWGDPPPKNAFHQSVLTGLSRFLFFGENKIDMDRVHEVLTAETPEGLLLRISQLRSLQGGTADRLLALDIAQKYNKGLPISKKVDEDALKKTGTGDRYLRAAKFNRKAKAENGPK